MFNKNAKAPYWALDISNTSVKIISLLKKRNKYIIENYGMQKLTDNSFDQGKILNQEEIIKTVKKTMLKIKGKKINSNFVKIHLPEKHTFLKLVSIPKMDTKEIPGAVEWAAEHHLPYSLEEIYFDWQILKYQTDSKNIQILIGAAPRTIVDDYILLLKKINLIPLAMEIESIALTKSIINENIIDKKTLGIIDIGSKHSTFIVYSRGTVIFSYQLELTGDNITQTISEKLSLSRKQAEDAKIICGVDNEKCKGGIKIILDESLKKFTKQIESAINYYKNNMESAMPIDNIILTGGGANMKRLVGYLEKKINIKTLKGNPLTNIDEKNGLIIPSEKIMSYATALGLAIND